MRERFEQIDTDTITAALAIAAADAAEDQDWPMVWQFSKLFARVALDADYAVAAPAARLTGDAVLDALRAGTTDEAPDGEENCLCDCPEGYVGPDGTLIPGVCLGGGVSL